jgi:nucleotide-binding universal stress UspA family protein
MKKILCPVDFSATADHAVAVAAKLAQKIGAQLQLLNVHSIREVTPAELVLGSAMKLAGTSVRLEQLSSEISKVYKISCYSEVQTSNYSLPHAICEIGNNYDLVVMGTNGEDQFYDSLFGTNSYLVAKESSVPVLLLPHDYEYQGFSKMIFALDYFLDMTSPPIQLIKWAELFDTQVTVLQVMEGNYRHRKDEQLQQEQRKLKQLLDNDRYNFKTIYSDQPMEGIMDFINANECDVLALCFRHHSFIKEFFHKDVVKNVASAMPRPLLLLHV